MLTARKALIGIAILMLASALLAIFEGARAPRGTGLGKDSYGVRGQGFRGLYETMEALGMDVRRSHVPPSAAGSQHPGATLILWAPESHILETELRHVEQLGQWVREGGRLVVTPPTNKGIWKETEGEESFFEHLGLGSKPFREVDAPLPAAAPAEVSPLPEDRKKDDDPDQPAPVAVQVFTEGAMRALLRDVHSLTLPAKSIMTLGREGDRISRDRLDFLDGEGRRSTLAASLPLGKGEVVIIADPRLAENKLLGQGDNAILMTLLLGEKSRSMVFDEFLHGLSSRGHPMHLLSRRPYGYVALGFLLTALLWCWRSAIFLGPPLPERREPRRGISEYIDAMANLFMAKKAYRFALGGVREGIMRRQARKHHLPPSKADATSVAKAIGKKDPDAAQRFTDSVAAVDTILKKKREPSARLLAQAARELTKCQ